MVDLNGEEFYLVPGFDGAGASGEEGGKPFETGTEGGETSLLDGGERIFGDDVAALEVSVSVDEDEDAAEVDVAEGVLGVGGKTGKAEPEHIDGDAILVKWQMGGGAGG